MHIPRRPVSAPCCAEAYRWQLGVLLASHKQKLVGAACRKGVCQLRYRPKPKLTWVSKGYPKLA